MKSERYICKVIGLEGPIMALVAILSMVLSINKGTILPFEVGGGTQDPVQVRCQKPAVVSVSQQKGKSQ